MCPTPSALVSHSGGSIVFLGLDTRVRQPPSPAWSWYLAVSPLARLCSPLCRRSARSSRGRAPTARRCLSRALRLPGARRPVAQPSCAPSSSQRRPVQFGRSGADICYPNLIARPTASPCVWTFGLQLSTLVIASYSNARPWCWPRAPRLARPRPHRGEVRLPCYVLRSLVKGHQYPLPLAHFPGRARRYTIL
jgi:hypothetical protein